MPRPQVGTEASASVAASPSKAAALRDLIGRPGLSFLMEAHNGLSARIAEEAGFEGIWASGLSVSAALGVRDSNEASWTQVLDVIEFMSDAASVPILVDGDTGYGNFNNMRRLVRKLEQRHVGGVCIEDKLFPKTNSFINGPAQVLADVDEFCGRIKAGKDAQGDVDFGVVARVEAFIAGWGLAEAMRRAEAYHAAGADAILIHSAKRTADEVLAFRAAWGDRLPVVIVPTKYYATSTDVLREAGFSLVIWANHLLRSAIPAMQRTAATVFAEQSLVNVEDRVAPVAEVFRLQGAAELEEAERRYLPAAARSTRAIVLGSARGAEFGELTAGRPKCMLEVAGAPILAHVVDAYRAAGVRDVTVVRGHAASAVDVAGVEYRDVVGVEGGAEGGDDFSDARALHAALDRLEGDCIVSYGDVLFRRHVPQELIDADADLAVMVDTDWRDSRNRDRYADYVTCSAPSSRRAYCGRVRLLHVAGDLPPGDIHGEWMGFLKLSPDGSAFLRSLLARTFADGLVRPPMDMAALLREVIRAGREVRVVYTTGSWLDVDRIDDLSAANEFQRPA